jgi:predicted nucleic acid-binding protein
VRFFVDTSVLVATFFGHHQDHDASADFFLTLDKSDAACGAHTLAEVYSTLTRMPGKRIGGAEALLFLAQIRERMTIVGLDPDEYVAGIEDAAAQGIMGGGIYDALLARCALKAKAQTIYTWNVKHFQRLGPDIAARVKTPPTKHS